MVRRGDLKVELSLVGNSLGVMDELDLQHLM